MPDDSAVTIWTIGHSTRTLDELIAVLNVWQIELVADVRRFPGSRRLPQFGAAPLESALGQAGIAVQWIPALGGRRRPRPDSVNSAWRVEGFRGYADHVESEEFAEGMFELLTLAGGMRTAIMCAEFLWWRCHRRLISDVLVTVGIPVVHIRDEMASENHVIQAPARIVKGQLTYAADTQLTLV